MTKQRVFLLAFGVFLAVFGLAQGLMVKHPSAPLFLLVACAGIVLAVCAVIRMSTGDRPRSDTYYCTRRARCCLPPGHEGKCDEVYP